MDDEGVTIIYGDVCLRKQRRKRQKMLVLEQLNDFAKNTTLHGLRYITDRELHGVEKIFWLITFICSSVLCSLLIRNVWVKWKTSPVIVTVSEELVPVGIIPFPSITICPQTKGVEHKYNYTEEKDYFDNLQYEDTKNTSESYIDRRNTFEDVSLVCDNSDFFYLIPLKYSDRNTSDMQSVASNILKVSPLMNNMFVLCSWRGEIIDCTDLFHLVFTQEGICYNMNSLVATEILREVVGDHNFTYLNTPSKGWTLEDGYSDNEPNPYPRRGRENGAKPDLSLYVMELPDKDKLCNSVNTGHKVYIHHPTDYPHSSLYYYGIIPQMVSSMAVSYTIMNTPDNVREYPADIRKCFFSDERYLQFFQIYTANNCRLECLTNYTLKKCSCVGYYMPYNSTMKICTYNKVQCMNDAQETMAEGTLDDDKFKTCNCLPACNTIEYDADILKTDFNTKDLVSYLTNANKELTDTQFSRLDVYFKNTRSISMRRSELFGKTDFIANCGGLLGLFLGFSFLSLIEIFYFITLSASGMFAKAHTDDFNAIIRKKANSLLSRIRGSANKIMKMIADNLESNYMRHWSMVHIETRFKRRGKKQENASEKYS